MGVCFFLPCVFFILSKLPSLTPLFRLFSLTQKCSTKASQMKISSTQWCFKIDILEISNHDFVKDCFSKSFPQNSTNIWLSKQLLVTVFKDFIKSYTAAGGRPPIKTSYMERFYRVLDFPSPRSMILQNKFNM